jgi:hypothetical protein
MNPNDKIQFSVDFERMLDASLKIYDGALDKLQGLINGHGFDEGYGVCNTRYQMLQIKPTDVSTYVSNLFKALAFRLVEPNISDLEKLSVEMAKQFTLENGGTKLANDNLFATSTYVDVRTQTLMDILVQAENAFFDRAAYSNYELRQRTKDMKKDFDQMKGMKLSASIKAIVKALPGIIQKQLQEPGYGGCCPNLDMIMTYIETFLLFTISLNTLTLEQMLGYLIPRTKFTRKDKFSPFQEAAEEKGFIDRENYKPIFIILSSGKSHLSPFIKKATGSKWSHCTIAFDADMSSMYSYGARLQDDPDHPNKMSMKRESLKASNLKGLDICVFATYIPAEKYHLVRSTCEEQYKNRDNTKFDLFLLVKKALNDDTQGSKKDGKKICTTFVNDLIKMCGEGLSDKAVPSPQQMRDSAEAKPDKCILVFDGVSDDYNEADVNAKLAQFEHKKISKPFVEYYTECCLVDTDDIQIRSKIPFDINMRNIVLQDVTNGFKETKTALHFMLKDNRSPIHGMLMKYSTNKRIANSIECGPTLGLFRPYYGRDFDPMIEQYKRLSFDTNFNWLDQITYGNQFMDGNYRMDAVGNENRHPIRQTLCMVHRMYCGCGLKTNEELADNILKIAGVMHAVISEGWSLENRDLTRDILAVLGDCFTRNVIRLYHNNTVIIVHDDNMEDTMAPGYMYVEEFVFQEDGEQQTPKPSVQAGFGDKVQNVVQKTGGLSKIGSLIRKFDEWITKKFANFPSLFDARNGAISKYIVNHDKLNGQIAAAINGEGGNKFIVNLQGIPQFKVPLKDMIQKAQSAATAFNDFKTNPDLKVDDKSVEELRTKLYPGDTSRLKTMFDANDQKGIAQAIENYILFSDYNPQGDALGSQSPTPINAERWNEIVDTLKNTPKLISEFTKTMTKSLKECAKVIDQIRADDEKRAQQAKTQNSQGTPKQESMIDSLTDDIFLEDGEQQPQPATTRADALMRIQQEVVTNYQLKALNSAFTKRLFNTYYDVYKQVITEYQNQTKQQQQNANNNANAAEAKQNSEGAPETPAAAPEVKTEEGGNQ